MHATMMQHTKQQIKRQTKQEQIYAQIIRPASITCSDNSTKTYPSKVRFSALFHFFQSLALHSRKNPLISIPTFLLSIYKETDMVHPGNIFKKMRLWVNAQTQEAKWAKIVFFAVFAEYITPLIFFFLCHTVTLYACTYAYEIIPNQSFSWWIQDGNMVWPKLGAR